MAKIIPFPEKEKFITTYGAHLPEELKQCLSQAYDEILEKQARIPSLEITVSNNQMESANKFKKEYRTFILEVFSELLIEKAAHCKTRYDSHKLR